jgi:putative tryptophan/tyrosine transport system substrate-binding protein
MLWRRIWTRAGAVHAAVVIAVLVALLSVAVILVPLAGEAQPAPRVPRIGLLAPNSPTDPRAERIVQALRHGLRELGYVEGQNIAIEFRWADGKYDRLPGLAAELVRLKVSVLVAFSPPAVQAAKQATETIPIVMAAVADPVTMGFVASLARPGGNITGLSSMQRELVGKRLEVLKEVAPKVSRVALLGNPANPNHASLVRDAQDAARALGVRLDSMEARDASEIDHAFAAMTTAGAGAVLVVGDPVFLDHRARIADHAVRRRLPTVFATSEFAEAGGLLAYGPSLADGFRRAATYVDKILKGAKASDLPIEQPSTFELVINLKTAKALGLTIPPALLQRADQVIQ